MSGGGAAAAAEPTRSISDSKARACSHWAARPQAEMALLKEYTSGGTPLARMRSSVASASFHLRRNDEGEGPRKWHGGKYQKHCCCASVWSVVDVPGRSWEQSHPLQVVRPEFSDMRANQMFFLSKSVTKPLSACPSYWSKTCVVASRRSSPFIWRREAPGKQVRLFCIRHNFRRTFRICRAPTTPRCTSLRPAWPRAPPNDQGSPISDVVG